MKKVIAIIAVLGLFTLGMSNVAAQDSAAVAETAQVDSAAATADETAADAADVEEEGGIHKVLKQKFIEGGAGFMASVAFCLIFGLALAIERIIYLSLASADTKKLLADVEKAINEGGVEKALEVCRNTRGPVASIFYQGLLRYDVGIDVV